MKNGDEMEFMSPFPRPFLMNPLQFLTKCELTAAQQKAIAILNLNYFRNCAMEEIKLIEGVIAEIENLESKG